jgi:membrane protein
MGPLLLIATGVAGLFFGAEAARGSLTAQFRSLLGESGSKAVEAMLAGASSEQTGVSLLLAVPWVSWSSSRMP